MLQSQLIAITIPDSMIGCYFLDPVHDLKKSGNFFVASTYYVTILWSSSCKEPGIYSRRTQLQDSRYQPMNMKIYSLQFFLAWKWRPLAPFKDAGPPESPWHASTPKMGQTSWGRCYHLYPINDSFDEQTISMSSRLQYSHQYPRPGVNAQRWTGFTLNLPSNLSLHSSFVINSTVAFLNVAFSSLILLSAQLLFTLFLPGVMLSFSLESKDLMEGLSAAITWQQSCNGQWTPEGSLTWRTFPHPEITAFWPEYVGSTWKIQRAGLLGFTHLVPTCIVSGWAGAWETYWEHLEKE